MTSGPTQQGPIEYIPNSMGDGFGLFPPFVPTGHAVESDMLGYGATMAVGDLASDERGTGARANGGKVPMELLPLLVVAESLTPNNDGQRHVQNALWALGAFQAGGGPGELRSALTSTAMAAGMTLQQLFDEAAGVLDHGRSKYAEFNWAKGMPWSVCIGCAARHLLRHMWLDPQAEDDESGWMHAGHVACNLIFLLQYAKTYREGDDRPSQLARIVQASTL